MHSDPRHNDTGSEKGSVASVASEPFLLLYGTLSRCEKCESFPSDTHTRQGTSIATQRTLLEPVVLRVHGSFL